MDKVYPVFEGRKYLRIPKEIKAEYEEKVGRFTDNTANYFIVVLELTQDMSEQLLSERVVQAMKEDCSDSAIVKALLQGGGNVGW